MNNLIPIICKKLGVEVGEEFKVSVVPEVIYRFTEAGLECVPVDSKFQWELSTLSFNNLIATEIIKLPFEPKVNDVYWTYALDNFEPVSVVWLNHATDYTRKIAGTVFRTKEETIKARPVKYEELTGNKWTENTGGYYTNNYVTK